MDCLKLKQSVSKWEGLLDWMVSLKVSLKAKLLDIVGDVNLGGM